MLLLLPLELQRNVLLWIPFGGPTLMRMQLVSRRIRDACDLAFARMHMRTLMASFASLHALWISPDPVTRKRVEWRCVPFVYRAAMYLELFTLPYDEDYDDYRLFPIPHHQATLLADLLIKNATLFTEATCHQRPLTGFSRYGHTDALLRILNHPSTVAKSHNNAALRWSAFHGHSGCVRALLNHGADPGVEEDFCLISACERGHADVLRALLEDGGANPAARENDGIRLASEGGHSACVRLLLKDPRVDPCVDNNCAFRWSAFYGNYHVVQLLIQDERIDPTAGNNFALRHSFSFKHKGILALLLSDDRVKRSAVEAFGKDYIREVVGYLGSGLMLGQ